MSTFRITGISEGYQMDIFIILKFEEKSLVTHSNQLRQCIPHALNLFDNGPAVLESVRERKRRLARKPFGLNFKVKNSEDLRVKRVYEMLNSIDSFVCMPGSK